MSDVRLDGKRAVVTGGSTGIGQNIAAALAKAGAEVWNLDIKQDDQPGVKMIVVDLTDWEATKTALESIGNVDLLVNNAGIAPPPASFVDTDKNTLDKTIDVNLKAAFNVAQQVAKSMIKQGKGGSIVNMSAVGALTAGPYYSPYLISKAGMEMMTKCMALELGMHKIRVNSVCPTIVLTEMGREHWSDPDKSGPYIKRTPLGKFAEIEDVTNVTLFLLSDSAAMVTGTSLPVDGGFLIA